MATNHTGNYQLNLWEATDKFVRTEFNENTQKIDAALKAEADARAALAQTVTAKADASTVADLTQTVNTKADASAVTALMQTVNTKADASAVAALMQTVNTKADASAVTELAQTVATKADNSTAIALAQTVSVKADASVVNTALAKKADTTAMDTALAKKADITAMNAALAEKADASTLDALVQQVAQGANCRVVTGTYAGTGGYGIEEPSTLTFPGDPFFLAVVGDACFWAVAPGTRTGVLCSSGAFYSVYLTWSKDAVSWYEPNRSDMQLNKKGQTYHYIALIEV